MKPRAALPQSKALVLGRGVAMDQVQREIAPQNSPLVGESGGFEWELTKSRAAFPRSKALVLGHGSRDTQRGVPFYGCLMSGDPRVR